MSYPRLKRSVRIAKLAHGVYVYEHHSGAHGQFAPIVGYWLSMCDGATPDDLIARCIAATYDTRQEDAAEFLRAQIALQTDYVDVLDEPEQVESRYDFADYYYKMVRLDRRFSSPVSAQLVLTHRCNFKCEYCFNSSSPEQGVGMSTAQWLGAIDQMGELGLVSADITGGEPFTRPDLGELLNAFDRNGILTTIFTNGSLITPEWAERLARIDDIIVQVSLDSPVPAQHDKLTCSRGAFGRVTGAVKLLAEAGVHVRVKGLMLHENHTNADKLIDLCAELGARSVMLDTFDLCAAGRGDESYFLTRAESEYMKELAARAKERYAGVMSVKYQEGRRVWRGPEDIIGCGAMCEGFTMLPDGEFTLCEKTAGDPSCYIGRFPEMSVGEMWRSPRLAAILDPPQESYEAPCRDCEHSARCRGGCPALRALVSAKPHSADPRCWKSGYADNPYRNREER